MTARRNGSDRAPSAAEWDALVDATVRFVHAEPWLRWGDDALLRLSLKIGSSSHEMVGSVMGGAGISCGLALAPGREAPPAWTADDVSAETMRQGTPAGSVSVMLERREKLGKPWLDFSDGIGWPPAEPMAPAFLLFGGGQPRPIDGRSALLTLLGLLAVVELDRTSPMVVADGGPRAEGEVILPGGGRGRFRAWHLPTVDEPSPTEPGTLRMSAREADHKLIPVGTMISLGSVGWANLPQLRREARHYQVAPAHGTESGDGLPVVILHPKRNARAVVERLAEARPEFVLAVAHEARVIVALNCAKTHVGLLEIDQREPGLDRFLDRKLATDGRHGVIVVGPDGRKVHGFFELHMRGGDYREVAPIKAK